MDTHNAVLNCFLKLGYSDVEGVCHGISIRWLEACLLGEEHVFHERIKHLERIVSSGQDIVMLMDAVKEKKGKNLSKEDEDLLDILAFFDSLDLYHAPYRHTELFGLSSDSNQKNIAFHSDLAASDKINALGGLTQVYSQALIPDEAELKHYLDELGFIMQAGSGSSKDVLGVLLSSFNHTLAVTYKPGNGWGFMDINQYPPKVYKVEETGLLAKMIIKGLNSVPPSSYLALDASIYTTTRNPQVYSLTTQLGQFKSSHVITQEIASREQNGMGLAWIAARIGDVALISELAKHQVDLNKADKDSFTPAHLAVQHGDVALISELGRHQVDFNKAAKHGVTPAHLAAQQGDVAVIVELARHGVDFNKANESGSTPAHIAAQNGHVAVITELAKHGVDFNKANENGATPAHLAARNGHVAVIAELAKHGVNFNKASRSGDTPAHLAAQNGHAAVITELAKNNVNVHQQNEHGSTLAHIAALHGHVAVIAELAKHQVDFNKTDVNGSTPAHLAARNGHVTVIAELAKHQVDFNKADKDGFTPAHIAALTGQSMVLDELIKSGADLSPSLISLTDWKGKAYLKKDAISRMNSFLNYHKDKQEVLLSPRDLAVIMGDENEIQRFLDNVVEPHLRYAGRADLAEKDKDNEPLPKDVIACLNQLIDLKRQNEIMESYLAETETLLNAIKENEQRIIDRKYYIDFIDEHKESYTNVMWHITSPAKEELFQNEAQLRHSGLSSTVLYGMSWATSLFSTCYRFLTPKLQQEYLDSLMPQTLDSQSKALFKRLLQEHKDNLKKEMVRIEHSITNINKKLFPQSEEILPLFNTLSSKNLQLLPIYEFSIVKSVRADDRHTPKEHTDTQNFMHQKSTMSILKIPATEREANIYAVFQLLECPLMCNEDGSIPRILKEIKAIIEEVDPEDEQSISDALHLIRNAIKDVDRQERPLVVEVLKIFDSTGSLNFRQIRNSLEALPGLNEFSLSLKQSLSGHST
ncbi:TPA: ankyrin repeat domain-containing protein [Legionella pneumophila]|uniref:ankyrin repeat domain-containing protein n=1 Tax=Legionella pneumophila TaxID=446 RepID=UPI0009B50DF1|nr:ankyrin repeat domain-containing protein [Legionella pneumophila]HAT1844325.1 ankyrin repeat domain-containing protein [Legionella pneumophila]HAT1860631.1 ankyrin repeat domain-containing protein [Legionella pneumophila]HAT1904890.1 ankyrin repeat domain-containing protein [Legionella pneumophila]HAT3890100.1 ankyrin repeat domain-containing protein [Legionella pneumophila]